ncbi:ceramide kinase-like [Ornithodoros turicata]|uniref:ceramide kinase-like n=1 Tax=Ornithodoros turicata TaxID=34597 RepID=UPI003138F9E1
MEKVRQGEGDALLVSDFQISGKKRRVTLYKNGIIFADESPNARVEFFPLRQLVAAQPCDCSIGPLPCRKGRQHCGHCTSLQNSASKTFTGSTPCLNDRQLLPENGTIKGAVSVSCLVAERTPLQASSLRLHVAKPVWRHSWTLQSLLLKGGPTDHNLIREWVTVLQRLIAQLDRPRRLIVFVNPFGGRKKAPSIYLRKVAPIFKLAGISTEVIQTRYSGHAKEKLLEVDLSEFDGVICVGGDGMVNEVINGVLLRAQIDAGIEANDARSRLHPATIKVGVIPAGSTDALVCTTTGENSPVTSALLIVMGAEVSVDVASIHSQEKLVRYSLGFLSYGFFGDNIKSSERYRWMGPLRYNWSGWQTFLKHKAYEGEVKVLVKKNGLVLTPYDPTGKERCRAGCDVCYKTSSKLQQEIKEELENNDVVRVQGQFLSISCALMANRCARSSAGVAPTAHLGNGVMDVILVTQCSRLNFLKFLLAIAKSETRSPFKYPFVHCFRTSSLEFVPKADNSPQGSGKCTSTWQCDGELLSESALQVRCHRQLLRLFAFGIEDREECSMPCIPCPCS